MKVVLISASIGMQASVYFPWCLQPSPTLLSPLRCRRGSVLDLVGQDGEEAARRSGRQHGQVPLRSGRQPPAKATLAEEQQAVPPGGPHGRLQGSADSRAARSLRQTPLPSPDQSRLVAFFSLFTLCLCLQGTSTPTPPPRPQITPSPPFHPPLEERRGGQGFQCEIGITHPCSSSHQDTLQEPSRCNSKWLLPSDN